jgi:hypothetical protein
MKLLRRFRELLWVSFKAFLRQTCLYAIPPAVAAIALIYISSQVFGYDVESRHSTWTEGDGRTCEGWLIFTPGHEGCRWELRNPNGRLVETARVLMPVGSFLSPSTLMDNLSETEEFTFFPNGQLESHGLVKDVDGQESSEWVFFNESGQKLTVSRQVNSLPHGVFRKWHLNGQLMFEQEFVAGLPNGIGRVWNRDGILIGEAHSKDGFAHNGVFPRHNDTSIGYLTVWRDGQQVEELGFEPDMPPIYWDIPVCSNDPANTELSQTTPGHHD